MASTSSRSSTSTAMAGLRSSHWTSMTRPSAGCRTGRKAMRNLAREPFPFGYNLDDRPAEHALGIWCDNFDTKVVVLPLVELPGLDGKPCLAFAVITNILGFWFGPAGDRPNTQKSRGGLRFELFTADDADERAEFIFELIRGSVATWV